MQQDSPIFAEIVEGAKDGTLARVVIFGKELKRVFLGDRHHEKAVSWVDAWNEHLERSWLEVRETSATIMEIFIGTLRDGGVEQKYIDAAIEVIKADAKG